jgi:hypothetical protein
METPCLRTYRRVSLLSGFRVCVRTRKEAAGLYSVLGGSSLLQQGELDFSPAENRFLSKEWALALDFSRPALKRIIRVEYSPATLKRCFPLLKQRAPTRLEVENPRLLF